MSDQLVQGFLEFRARAYGTDESSMPRLVRDGQAPDYFIISCIDSRANPGTIFSPAPGTFFAHKAMGAIVRPYKKGTALAAALHFALTYNKVREIIILGHTQCGAVKALVDGLDDEEISSFVEVAQSSLEKAKECCCVCEETLHSMTEKQIILQSVENLKTYPSVQKALAENRVTTRPWLFDMAEGDLLEYDEDKEDFCTLLDEKEAG